MKCMFQFYPFKPSFPSEENMKVQTIVPKHHFPNFINQFNNLCPLKLITAVSSYFFHVYLLNTTAFLFNSISVLDLVPSVLDSDGK